MTEGIIEAVSRHRASFGKGGRSIKSIHKNSVILLLSVVFLTSMLWTSEASAAISDYFSFIWLSEDYVTLDIGETVRLSAISSDLKKPGWKSSDSKIASVSSNGVVTAKKPGVVRITAKSKNSEAVCLITVNETIVSLDKYNITVENGESFRLSAWTSNGAPVRFKSDKKSVATVSASGTVTAVKPGVANISVTADTTTVICRVTVAKPGILLNKGSVNLEKGGRFKLIAVTSSGKPVTFKTNKTSVVSVSDNGTITAKKHGEATVTATLDGVTAECIVTVKSPEITLSEESLSLVKGDKYQLTANVSSGQKPQWSSSNTSIVTVSDKGLLTAKAKGHAYVYASEDGTKVRCEVTVSEKP